MLKPLSLVLLGLLPGCAIFAQEAEIKLPDKEHFQLFLLAGQSNMAGRGKMDESSTKAHARVFCLAADGTWKPAVDPLHYDKQVAGAGLGKTFGEMIADTNPQICVGLIPSACGGAPISSWAPGATNSQTKSKPYDDAIARCKIAMEKGTLKAILWHQGESDCSDKAAPLYEEKLREVINRLRADLNAPDVPFIIGQLGQFKKKPWTPAIQQVDAAQQNVAKTMKNVYFVSSDQLAGKDGLHFNTESLRTLAKRYGEVYLQQAK